MDINELIDKLLKIKDKKQKIYYFNSDNELDLLSFNDLREIKYEGEDIVILEWNDHL